MFIIRVVAHLGVPIWKVRNEKAKGNEINKLNNVNGKQTQTTMVPDGRNFGLHVPFKIILPIIAIIIRLRNENKQKIGAVEFGIIAVLPRFILTN